MLKLIETTNIVVGYGRKALTVLYTLSYRKETHFCTKQNNFSPWDTCNISFADSHALKMSRDMNFPTMWYVRPAKTKTSLRIRED